MHAANGWSFLTSLRAAVWSRAGSAGGRRGDQKMYLPVFIDLVSVLLFVFFFKIQ